MLLERVRAGIAIYIIETLLGNQKRHGMGQPMSAPVVAWRCRKGVFGFLNKEPPTGMGVSA